MTKTTNNTTTVKSAKVDFFQSARSLSLRTSEFFRAMLKKAELNTIYSAKIASNEASIASIDDMLNGNTKLDVSEEDLLKMRKNYESMNESLHVEWDKLVEEQATFAYNEQDKAFKKAMKNATCKEDVIKAVRVFFTYYKLAVDNTTFEQAVLESIGKKTNVKTLVKSEGKKVLVYDVTNALKNLYGVGFEWMVEAGTIKPAQIPSVLVDKYTKKSKKSAKKEEKKVA